MGRIGVEPEDLDTGRDPGPLPSCLTPPLIESRGIREGGQEGNSPLCRDTMYICEFAHLAPETPWHLEVWAFSSLWACVLTLWRERIDSIPLRGPCQDSAWVRPPVRGRLASLDSGWGRGVGQVVSWSQLSSSGPQGPSLPSASG